MKTIIVAATLSCLLIGCDLGESFDRQAVTIEFALLSTSGMKRTAFTVPDTIIVRFRITNNSGKPLSYHYTGTPIILKILKAGSVVASSVDGMEFAQVIRGDVLQSGQSLGVDWRIPGMLPSGATDALQAGSYEAIALAGGVFDSFQVSHPGPIPFTMYPGGV